MFIEGNHTFGLLKQNLQLDTQVVIGRTTDPELDGATGIILGKSADNLCDHYIVLLDVPHSRGDKAISLTEACISPL